MTTAAPRKPRLAIVAPDLPRALSQGLAMRRLFELTMVESLQPLCDAIRLVCQGFDCVITRFRQTDSVVDVRTLLSAAGSVPILFLVERLPVRAPVARLIASAGDAILCESECVVVLEATLVALLAGRGDARV